MDTLQRHEIFEIDVLDKLKNNKFLEPLVFGGGTMLRLCYEINRYSADLDFWFLKKVDGKAYFKRLGDYLKKEYEVTDAQIKFYTFLFELRSKNYPKRLKIEIRKEAKPCDFQERIAFSRFSARQVVLRVHTLEQTMNNKIEAALERGEVRDFFDIEFLLKKGIPLNASANQLAGLRKAVTRLNPKDISATLGSVLEAEIRRYYSKNGFSYLIEKLQARM